MFCKSFALVNICVASERCFRVGYFSELRYFVFVYIPTKGFWALKFKVFDSHKDVSKNDCHFSTMTVPCEYWHRDSTRDALVDILSFLVFQKRF